MIVDLHAHYPMHLVTPLRVRLGRLVGFGKGWRGIRFWVRSLLVGFASLFINYRTLFSGPRVRMQYMRDGGVGVALSVLYSFFDEIDGGHNSPPRPGGLDSVERQMKGVEEHVAAEHEAVATIAHRPIDLAAAAQAGKLALVHCVEGGFHLGADEDEIKASVKRLADRGVAYITLAHLIYRGIATDAPALPFMSDEDYRRWFHQDETVGLSALGRAAVRAMHANGILIDMAHMSERAIDDTLDLLDDELDPAKSQPVLVTHAGYRFGQSEYMLDTTRLRRIAERGGVVGLIFAHHQMHEVSCETSRMPSITKRRRFQKSFDILRCHIEHIHAATGSHEHTALGSDLDGFIKPTLPGLEDMRAMEWLEQALLEEYKDDGRLICSENALRVLTSGWRGRVD